MIVTMIIGSTSAVYAEELIEEPLTDISEDNVGDKNDIIIDDDTIEIGQDTEQIDEFEKQDYDDEDVTGISEPSPAGTVVTLNYHDISLTLGNLIELEASADGVTWESDDTNIVSVQQVFQRSAYIKAMNFGKTTIRVKTADGAYDECLVEVVERVAVKGVKLSKTSASIGRTDTLQLTATVTPENAADKSVTWQSDTPSVATVTSDGLVQAVSPGSAIITVTTKDQGKTASFKLTVKPPVAVRSVKMNVSKKNVYKGENVELKATISPSNAENKCIKWSSSDPNIACVSSGANNSGEANIIQCKNEGVAVITATTDDGGFVAICTITVKIEVIKATSITLNQTSVTIKPNQTVTLTATVQPNETTDKTITWTSLSTKIATVSDTGVVTGINNGKTKIKAKCGNKYAYCEVNVSDGIVRVTSLKLSKSSLTIGKNETVSLSATVKPDTAKQEVVWKSSDAKIATVDAKGNVTGKKEGKATITATTKGTNKKGATISKTCRVTVKKAKAPTSTIEIDKKKAKIEVGKTVGISCSSNTSVIWKSSNPKVAKIIEVSSVNDGKWNSGIIVKGIKKGTATITAKTSDKKKTAKCKIIVTESNKVIKVKSIKLNKKSAKIKVGGTLILKETITPGTASNKNVKWNSSNVKVATVDKNGKVKGIKKGKATITVSTDDGNKKAKCKVIVK